MKNHENLLLRRSIMKKGIHGWKGKEEGDVPRSYIQKPDFSFAPYLFDTVVLLIKNADMFFAPQKQNGMFVWYTQG
jgi:hypothetical protein